MNNSDYNGMITSLSSLKNSLEPIENYQLYISNITASLNEMLSALLEPLRNFSLQYESLIEAIIEPLHSLTYGINNVLNESLQNMSFQFSELAKSYALSTLVLNSDSTSDRFIELSDSIIDDLISEPEIPQDECLNSFNSIKSVTEKRKLTIEDIYKIITLLITIWALVKSYVPDQPDVAVLPPREKQL